MKLGARMMLLFLLNSAGCSTYLGYSVQNVVFGPVDCIQEYSFRLQIHRLAHEAWAKVERDAAEKHSHSYACGFQEGYVDFIDNNGTGEPPATPPARLQRAGFRTPDAQAQILDWYAGFRHGAQLARESGLRERFLVPIALPPRDAVGEPVLRQTHEPIPLRPAESPVPPNDPAPR